MHIKYESKSNTQIKGYYLFSNYHSCFLDCITINELLHVLHTYIVNTESFYERMPVIAKKEDEAVGTITLYGRPSILAETIFNSLDFNINSSIIDILSLKQQSHFNNGQRPRTCPNNRNRSYK